MTGYVLHFFDISIRVTDFCCPIEREMYHAFRALAVPQDHPESKSKEMKDDQRLR